MKFCEYIAESNSGVQKEILKPDELVKGRKYVLKNYHETMSGMQYHGIVNECYTFGKDSEGGHTGWALHPMNDGGWYAGTHAKIPTKVLEQDK